MKLQNKKAFIFDLDGVIVDTAKFHYLAWKNLAKKIDIDFTESENEQLKGVSRVKSLEKILQWGNKSVSDNQFEKLMSSKNEEYLSYVDKMTEEDILPGVKSVLDFLKSNNYLIALGSASKNARIILKHTNLTHYFDVIVDGNEVSNAKPDPEVFTKGCDMMDVKHEDAIVFEDSQAGIQAANNANMISVGIGSASILNEADFNFNDFTEIDEQVLNQIIAF
ncbi:beta-phosphoglucomutase [Psychroflexus aestuariivivens]|uniref:beta-phosphoglucomutase n=1 Tax=Psychroflexus aestuariivivens TaxID=1795040 RepID=UPI000FD6E886|nr:beta-phosphoglucomutase [Psychroflexus aestuariivivens]